MARADLLGRGDHAKTQLGERFSARKRHAGGVAHPGLKEPGTALLDLFVPAPFDLAEVDLPKAFVHDRHELPVDSERSRRLERTTERT
jgi:uncharacterized protein YceK